MSPPQAQAAVGVAPWEDIPPEESLDTASSGSRAERAEHAPTPVPFISQDEPLKLPVVELPPARMDRVERSVTETGAASTQPRRLVPTDLGDVWHAVAQELTAQGLLTGFARELLLQSQLLEQAGQEAGATHTCWTLRVENETLNHEGSRKRLEGALGELGHAVLLRIECGRVVDTPAMRLASERAAEQERAEQVFRGHPYVQAMMRDLGAQPVAGSIRFIRDTGAPGA